MPGISTEYLAEQLEASNARLTKALDELARKMDEGQKEFNHFRLDVTDKLSAIRNSFLWMGGIATVIITIATTVAANRINAAADRSARTEERIVKLLESRVAPDAQPKRP